MRALLLFCCLLFCYSAIAECAAPDWVGVEKLVGEQKLQAALDRTHAILKQAREKKNERLQTEAIVKATELEMGLQGFETAVRFLKTTPWPKDGSSRALLDLYYAHALGYYYNSYSWEIGGREKTASAKDLDLKSWTSEQIGREISKSFDAAMAEGPALSSPVPDFFRPYMAANNYPASVRPTLRDAIVYMAVAHMVNSSFWTPREASEVYKLDFPKLTAALTGEERIPAAAVGPHPLTKVASWLAEHGAFHEAAKRGEAALEARYVLLEALHGAVLENADRAMIRKALRAAQSNGGGFAWWSRGQALLAQFLQAEERAGNLIDARAEALKGRDAFPASVGGEMCAAIVSEISRTEFVLQSMQNDGAQKRSLLVDYRNARKVFFRAYRLDIEAMLKSARPQGLSNLVLADVEQLLAGTKPEATWKGDLEETRDFRIHRAFFAPPALPAGHYAVVSSLREDFGASDNSVQAVHLNIGDLVLKSRPGGAGDIELRAIDGESGRAASGTAISLYRYNGRTPMQEVKREVVDANGYAVFQEPPKNPAKEYWNYFFVARKGGQAVVQSDGVWFGRSSKSPEVSSALVYTDRSIYRPGQKLHFKVVGYRGEPGKLAAVKAGEMMKVRFLDGNSQLVGEKQIKLNAFGSAAGEFLIPPGRALGHWTLQTTGFIGYSSVKVEEYKRPTFEVSLKEAKEPLRLNQKARLTGEARYYFGSPVNSGKVQWRISRMAVAPWWWEFRGWWDGGSRRSETAASGSSEIRADGSFQIEFTPEGDERGKAGLSYSFSVEADVTDGGGETRSASRSFRVGLVAMEAKIDAAAGFFRAGQPIALKALLTDLDGNPLAGSGSYRVSRLSGKVSLPAELPSASEPNPFSTKGDALRARWETEFRWELVTAAWKSGETVAEGRVEHNAKGEGNIALKAVEKPGVYRLTYKNKDRIGAAFEVSRDFLVGAPSGEIPLPLILSAAQATRKVGEVATFLVQSGLEKQPLTVEIFRSGRRVSRRELASGQNILELPVTREDRGGFTVVVSGVRDHQVLRAETSLDVPWSDKELKVEFSTFRDKLRPGAEETFRISVKGDKGETVGKGGAEILAYMYDRSLDFFTPHSFPEIKSLYPSRAGASRESVTLGAIGGMSISHALAYGTAMPSLMPDRMEFQPTYGIGGPGARGGRGQNFGAASGGMQMMSDAASNAAPEMAKSAPQAPREAEASPKKSAGDASAPISVRSNFLETAFFAPHLITGAGGVAAVEFTAPDSVTSWRVLAHAVTPDFRGGSVSRETRTVKELMVRPYAPRFLREGDEADLKVQVNNAGDTALSGELFFEIENNQTGKSALREFGLSPGIKKSFSVQKSGSVTLAFPLRAPKNVGDYAFKVTAKAGSFSDGERRPFPVLPSRQHLVQSRFVTLRQKDKKEMQFPELAAGEDPSLLNERMVVTVDAQLFYGVLQALPYLVNYPYECVEQTLNRFLSTGIVSSVFQKYPAAAKMAKEMSARKTKFESFNEPDANRRMSLEETPWLEAAQGGKSETDPVLNMLEPESAKAERERALAKLQKMQLPSGGFPWFEGGPADEHMTLYLLLGLGRALEFKVEVPRDLVSRAWAFERTWLDEHLAELMQQESGWENVTMINFVLSSYPSEAWTGGLFDQAFRKKLLAYSFSHWKQHSPLLKGYLALTLKRMGRESDAKLVWESVMDSAKQSDELGTYWAREDRSWLWYNDETDTQAFALRVQMELFPGADKVNEGLVQWLFLNKKLNHWKSTRATAEVIYSLVRYLDAKDQLGKKESVKVDWGTQSTEFQFDPGKYTGKKNQIVIEGEKVDPKSNSQITVSKSTPGLAFASATWHFSTEKLPKEESGDFFGVTRKFFRRELKGQDWQLVPLSEGAKINVGDQLEVQLSLRTKHEAEYVLLRDPRGAGFEPESATSGYKWDLGIYWFEEIRDSGTNFFFSQLPVGEYTFKYRLRANMAGHFRVGAATVQSIYAPEFNAYSSGEMLRVE